MHLASHRNRSQVPSIQSDEVAAEIHANYGTIISIHVRERCDVIATTRHDRTVAEMVQVEQNV